MHGEVHAALMVLLQTLNHLHVRTGRPSSMWEQKTTLLGEAYLCLLAR